MPIPITVLLPLLTKAVPIILRTFSELRAKYPDATEAEVFGMTAAECAKIIEAGKDWLASHPEQPE